MAVKRSFFALFLPILFWGALPLSSYAQDSTLTIAWAIAARSLDPAVSLVLMVRVVS